MAVVTVTLNAAVDHTLHVDRLRPGARARATSEHRQAGGKGVNVARVLAALGVPVRAVVVVGGEAGRFIVDDLDRSGIAAVAVVCRGESRTCVEVIERDGRATQAYGPGVVASEETVEAVLDAVSGACAGARWIAVAGSLSGGMPVDAPARIVGLARERGLASSLDIGGPALAEAWSRRPDLVRVNAEEASAAFGIAPEAIARDRPANAPARGVISSGSRPFVAWAGHERWRVTPPRVESRNPIGCGDAMHAGLLARLTAGDGLADALRFATALASAEATSPVAGRPDLALARALAGRVQIEDVPAPTVGEEPDAGRDAER